MVPNDPVRWLFVLVGLFWIYFGVRYLADGEGDKPGQALVMLFPLGIAFLAMGFAKPSDPGSVEGVQATEVSGGPEPRRATVFNPVPGRRMTSVIALSGFMCLGLGMVLFPGEGPNVDQGAVRGIGTVFALIFAALIFLSLRGMTRGHMTVVLTPDWVLQRNRLRNQLVDWDEIDGVSVQQWRASFWTVLHRRGADVMIPHQFMAADPAVFHALVAHMHAHPEDRPLLADPGGERVAERFRVVDAGGPRAQVAESS